MSDSIISSPFFARSHDPCIDLEGDLHAMSMSPDMQLVAVASKEVKILSTCNGKFQVDKTLRAPGQNTRAVGEVKWHPSPVYSHYICSAPTNGKVILWNLQKDGNKRRENILEDHLRSVNKLSWHPTDPMILTASMDGDVRLWDVKVPSHSSMTFPNSACCRDVAFHPFNHFLFAAAYEDGSVQFWDRRKGRKGNVSTINAHNGLILSIDWHPSLTNVLATGGRDKTIKVWDMNDTIRPRHVVQTSTSVNRVHWRGSAFPTHITSSASLMDFRIHLWDIESPFVPLLQIKGHKEIVTGFIWSNDKNADSILSCSKDGTIRKQHVEDCIHPYQSIRTRGIAWNRDDELAVFSDEVDRNVGPFVHPKRYAMNGEITIVKSRNAQENKKKVLIKTKQMTASETFVYFAKNYRLRGDSINVLCAHNAEIAKYAEKPKLTQMWMMIAAMFGTTTNTTPAPQKNEDIGSNRSLLGSFLPVIGKVHNAGPIQNNIFSLDFKLKSLQELLNSAAEQGDVQTCVTVMSVLEQHGIVSTKKKTNNNEVVFFPQLLRQKWLFAYLQMLSRFELFAESTEVLNSCKEEETRMQNQKSTQISVICPHCNKQSQESFARGVCDRCHRTMSHCSICEESVRGVFVWCQGCGHGGHLDHMNSWFKDNTVCPTGCLHVCNIITSEA